MIRSLFTVAGGFARRDARRGPAERPNPILIERLEDRRLLAASFASGAPTLGSLAFPNTSGYEQYATNATNATGNPVYFVSPNGSGTSRSRTAPGSFPATIANSNLPNGSTIVFLGGASGTVATYRNIGNVGSGLSVSKSNLILQADRNAQVMIKGSDTASEWQSEGNNIWSSPWTTSTGRSDNASVDWLNYPEASYLDMAFRNGASLMQTADNPFTSTAEVPNLPADGSSASARAKWQDQINEYAKSPMRFGPGKFWIGTRSGAATQRVYIHSTTNPVNDTIEVSKRRGGLAVAGSNSNGLTLQGVTMAHYGQAAVDAASQNMNIRNSLFAWNGVSGVNFTTQGGVRPSGAQVTNNRFISNGRAGFNGNSADNALLAGNVVNYNNVEGFNGRWSAAGLKFVSSRGMTIQNNSFLNNYRRAHDLWIDTSCIGTKIINNTIRKTIGEGSEIGIHVELGHNTMVAFNIIDFGGSGIGIQVADSSATRVFNNTVYNAGVALEVKDSDRANGQSGDGSGLGTGGADPNDVNAGAWWVSRENVVRNNLFSNSKQNHVWAHDVSTDVQQPVGTSGSFNFQHNNSRTMFASGNNAVNYNGYFGATPSNLAWRWKSGSADSTVVNRTVADHRDATGLEANHVRSETNPFVNAGAGNFNLVSGSAASGAGTVIPSDIVSAGRAAGLAVNNPNSPNLGAR